MAFHLGRKKRAPQREAPLYIDRETATDGRRPGVRQSPNQVYVLRDGAYYRRPAAVDRQEHQPPPIHHALQLPGQQVRHRPRG